MTAEALPQALGDAGPAAMPAELPPGSAYTYAVGVDIDEITEENNITTVINTHDMNSVMEIGQNIILLFKGQIAWRGPAADVMPAFARVNHLAFNQEEAA